MENFSPNKSEYESALAKVKGLIQDADAIVIGAGAGLSASAGIHYNGPKFEKDFADFIARYHFTDLYSAGFYPFTSPEERWAYWAKHVYSCRYESGTRELYKTLRRLIENKEHFVITTNVDAQFEKAGFAMDKLFAVQGDYGKWQCSVACHDIVYDNEEQIMTMLEHIHDCKIPSELVPMCPHCGKHMDMNLHKDEFFVRDAHWHTSFTAYKAFIEATKNQKVVFLELGVGYNTPTIIRYPFEHNVYLNKNACLIRINKDDYKARQKNFERIMALPYDIAQVINDLAH